MRLLSASALLASPGALFWKIGLQQLLHHGSRGYAFVIGQNSCIYVTDSPLIVAFLSLILPLFHPCCPLFSPLFFAGKRHDLKGLRFRTEFCGPEAARIG